MKWGFSWSAKPKRMPTTSGISCRARNTDWCWMPIESCLMRLQSLGEARGQYRVYSSEKVQGKWLSYQKGLIQSDMEFCTMNLKIVIDVWNFSNEYSTSMWNGGRKSPLFFLCVVRGALNLGSTDALVTSKSCYTRYLPWLEHVSQNQFWSNDGKK